MHRWPKIIAHADMDAFYAAVEQLDNPNLRGKPVLIGGKGNRGVVLTASYEARPFGVGSAMPMGKARRLCPNAIVVSPRFERYQEISAQIMQIFQDFSPKVEALSLDEAFLDMSGAEHFFGAPLSMGQKIKKAVWDATGLHISVGVSATKYVAKVASAFAKPNGLVVVPAGRAQAWLAPQPVNRLWGVGKKNTPRLTALGYHTIGDVAQADKHQLYAQLGSLGRHCYQLAHAQDPRRVRRGRVAKSLGSDRTLAADISNQEEIRVHLRKSAERIAQRLRAKDYVAHGVRIRLKTSKFELLSRQQQLTQPADTADMLYRCGCELLSLLLTQMEHPGPFRLVGMAAFDLDWADNVTQLDLFIDDKPRRLETTIDALSARFGKDSVVRACDLKASGQEQHLGVNLDFLEHIDEDQLAQPTLGSN